MARLGPLLLKGAGAVLLAIIALSVIATIVSVVLSIVGFVVATLVSLAMLAVVGLAVYGLFTLLGGDGDADDYAERLSQSRSADAGSGPAGGADGPKERLQSRYVDGELSEAEFERELDRLLEDDGHGRSRSDDLDLGFEGESTDRSRLRDR